MSKYLLGYRFSKDSTKSLIQESNYLSNLLNVPGLKITVGHWTTSDQNQKMSDQTKNTPDIPSDGKSLRQNEISDQIMLLSGHKLKMSD